MAGAAPIQDTEYAQEIVMPPSLLNRRAATAALVSFPMVWTGVRAQPATARR